MKNILIALLFTGCVQIQATDPEVCLSKTLDVPGLNLGQFGLNQSNVDAGVPVSIPLGIGNVLTNVQILTQDSSVSLSNSTGDNVVVTLDSDGGAVNLLTLSNGAVIFSGANLAPFLDGNGTLNGFVSVNGTVPEENMKLNLNLCLTTTVSDSWGL
jgi:hypothetical protein